MMPSGKNYDPNAEWDPQAPKSVRPGEFAVKLPATYRCRRPMPVYSAPSADAPILPRVVQIDTMFSVEEAFEAKPIRGKRIHWLKPKRNFFERYQEEKPDEEYGKGGWLCDHCLQKGPFYLVRTCTRYKGPHHRGRMGPQRPH